MSVSRQGCIRKEKHRDLDFPTMAKRNAGSNEGFRETFNREIGLSHPRSISRRICASEVLIFSPHFSKLSLSLSLSLACFRFRLILLTTQVVESLVLSSYTNCGFWIVMS